jgi:hypothetical protein
MFPIEMMCKVLGVSRSGFYSWLRRKPSKRALENEELMDQIRKIHKKSKETYGSPRICKELLPLSIPESILFMSAYLNFNTLRPSHSSQSQIYFLVPYQSDLQECAFLLPV